MLDGGFPKGEDPPPASSLFSSIAESSGVLEAESGDFGDITNRVPQSKRQPFGAVSSRALNGPNFAHLAGFAVFFILTATVCWMCYVKITHTKE
jgi:hypothetical protein